MQKSNAPTQLTVAFASGTGAGPVNTIPIPASSTAGAASWTTGFTGVNMEPIGSGGIPPFGADFNGLFNALSNAQIWQQSGYLYPYSSAFATAVGGYPIGAALQMGSGLGLWVNQADGNTTNPDASSSANWVELCANAGGTAIAMSGSSVTPTANLIGAPLLILTGALTAACKLVLPLRKGASWKILNSTTGGQTVTVGGATGSTVTIAAGATGAQEVFTDGTNFYTTSFNGAGVYLPINGTALAATALATPRTIGMTGDVSWTSAAFDGTSNVTGIATISNGAVSLAKMANLAANTLLGNPTSSAATPAAIALANGLQFSGGNLGMGAITPASVAASGAITSSTNITATGTVTAGTNFQSSSANVVLATTGAGGVFLRPNGTASTTGQVVVDSSGNMSAPGTFTGNNLVSSNNITANTNFLSSNGFWLASGISPCSFFFRPAGVGSTTNQMTLDTSGNLSVAAQVSASSFNATSDLTLKDVFDGNWEPRNIAAVAPLIGYRLHDDEGQRNRVGLGAQTVQAYAKEHVAPRPDGKLGLDYGALAVEQSWYNQRQLVLLDARVAELERRVN